MKKHILRGALAAALFEFKIADKSEGKPFVHCTRFGQLTSNPTDSTQCRMRIIAIFMSAIRATIF